MEESSFNINNNNNSSAYNLNFDSKEEEELSPSELIFDDHVFDFAFHPQQDLVVAGLITGKVQLYKYGIEENLIIHDQYLDTKEPCRATRFSLDGKYIFAGGKDGHLRVIDVETGKTLHKQENAHNSPISTMELYGPNMLVTGDDEGGVKVWDLRKTACRYSFVENEDYISNFAISEDTKRILAAGGDGYLSVFDMRKGVLDARSDNMEDELLSIAIIKGGKKVVVGTQDGILDIWSWGYWGDISDRFPGHPKSIESIVPIDDDTICTASSDGMIRVVSVFPNKLVGIVGEHQDFPVERIRRSRDGKYLASCSHDMTIKFWNLDYLLGGEEEASEMKDNQEDDSDDSDDMEVDNSSKSSKSMPSRSIMQQTKQHKQNNNNFFSGLL